MTKLAMLENWKERLLEQLGRIEMDESVVLAVRAWGEEAIEALRGVVGGDMPSGDYERANAAYLLGEIVEPEKRDEVIQDLARLQKDRSARVRLSALHAATKLGGPGARKLLLSILDSDKADETERIHAAELIADIGQVEDLDTLKNLKPKAEAITLQRCVDLTVEKIVLRFGRPPLHEEDRGAKGNPPQGSAG